MAVTGSIVAEEDEGFETGASPRAWTDGANNTVADSAAWSYEGTKSMLIAVTSSSVLTYRGSGAIYGVSPSTSYTLGVYCRARDNGRAVKVGVNQFTSGYVPVGGTTAGGAGSSGSTASVTTSADTAVYLTLTTSATTAILALFPAWIESGEAVASDGFYFDSVWCRTDSGVYVKAATSTRIDRSVPRGVLRGVMRGAA